MKVSRRQFLKTSLAAGALIGAGGTGSLFMPRSARAATSSPKLAKWGPGQALRGLGGTGIPVLSGIPDPVWTNTTFYQVTAGEFTDTLHPALSPTKLWGYRQTGSNVNDQRHLGGVIIANRGTAARLRFTNTLPSTHIIPVDTTLPGANQAQNRIAVHIHGGFVPWISDGGPFDWWAPDGTSGLSFLNGPLSLFDNIVPGNATYPQGLPMLPGQADYFYPNNQSTRLMWYHDHAHGITRINAYAGLATGYLLLDPAQEAALATKVPSLASTVPLIFQDKIFNTDGSLFYESVYDPTVFRLLTGGIYLPPPVPSVIPEFFGDTMLCNGTVYPYLEVEPKAYRFLMLNACNARFLNINMLGVTPGGELNTDPNTLLPTNSLGAGPPMVQIGTEGGYLIREVYHPNNRFFDPATRRGNMLLGPAERSDFIVDFTGLENREFIMYNDAPGPFPDGPASFDHYRGNLAIPLQPDLLTGPDTRQILKIKVLSAATAPIEPRPDPNVAILNPSFMDPAPLVPYTTTQAPIPPLVIPNNLPVSKVRDLTLNEGFDEFGRLKQLIGTTTPGLVTSGFGLDYLYPVTEVVKKGAVEVWRIFNLTADTHPMHFHVENFQVISRQPFRISRGRFVPSGSRRGPEPDELGWKETIKMHPGEVITIVTKFDLPATPFIVPTSPRAADMKLFDPAKKYHEFVWHCHILEHEEHDMMRPLVIWE